jgi:hypothetical protein
MSSNRFTVVGALLGAAIALGCSSNDSVSPVINDPLAVSFEDQALEAAGGISLSRSGTATVLRGTGSIALAMTQFRALLGEPLNPNTAGQKTGGRREINWDGVPATLTDVDSFPGDFFNARSPRGVLFTTPGTGFRVSDNGFVDVNASYAGDFKAFSPTKTFATLGSTIIDIKFVVAGSATPARVAGFGVVFAGADRSGAAMVQYFDANDQLLLTVNAPRGTDASGQSFAGALFASTLVARVRITSGQAALGATTPDDGKTKTGFDLVVMDDFLYTEPTTP